LLLALKRFTHETKVFRDFPLAIELEKLMLNSSTYPTASGIPLYVSNRASDNFEKLPALEPTCFLLFYYWDFNPFRLTEEQ